MGCSTEVLVLAGNAGSCGPCPLTPREVVRAWSRLRPEDPMVRGGDRLPAQPGLGVRAAPGAPGLAPAPEVSRAAVAGYDDSLSPSRRRRLRSPGPRLQGLAPRSAESSPAPAPLPRPGARWALPAPGAASRRAGASSTGPPAPSIARGPRRRTGKPTDPPVTEGSAPLRRPPRRGAPGPLGTGKHAGFPGRDVASFQAPPRRVGGLC